MLADEAINWRKYIRNCCESVQPPAQQTRIRMSKHTIDDVSLHEKASDRMVSMW